MSALREIATHAREAWPRECCGLLIGAERTIHAAHRARNLHESPTRYLLHPEDHFAAVRLARARALEVVGAYHSHPAGRPAPSATDEAQAEAGGFLYVIAGVRRLRRAAWLRRRRSRNGAVRRFDERSCELARGVSAARGEIRSRRGAPHSPTPRGVQVQGHWVAAWRLVDGNFVPVPLVRLP